MAIFKKINFTVTRLLFFQKDVDIEKVLVSKKIHFDEKTYKYFIGYLHKDHKVTPLYMMLPKRSTYVKSCDGQTECVFWLMMMTS